MSSGGNINGKRRSRSSSLIRNSKIVPNEVADNDKVISSEELTDTDNVAISAKPRKTNNEIVEQIEAKAKLKAKVKSWICFEYLAVEYFNDIYTLI